MLYHPQVRCPRHEADRSCWRHQGHHTQGAGGEADQGRREGDEEEMKWRAGAADTWAINTTGNFSFESYSTLVGETRALSTLC